MISEGDDVNSNPLDSSADGVVELINGSGCGKLNSENGDVSYVAGVSSVGTFIPKPLVSSADTAGGG